MHASTHAGFDVRPEMGLLAIQPKGKKNFNPVLRIFIACFIMIINCI